MTSFLTHRTRVHDARLSLRRRHSALRTCITLFAPYGFRATYHHLTLSAAIPRRLEADPDALVRAVEELHEARVLWLARAEEYAAQRRAEKWAGRRAVVNPRPWWLRAFVVGRAGAQPLRSLTFSVAAGRTECRSPTTPKSTSSKIGASGSLLTATMVFEVCMPARCWIAPEMPLAT